MERTCEVIAGLGLLAVLLCAVYISLCIIKEYIKRDIETKVTKCEAEAKLKYVYLVRDKHEELVDIFATYEDAAGFAASKYDEFGINSDFYDIEEIEVKTTINEDTNLYFGVSCVFYFYKDTKELEYAYSKEFVSFNKIDKRLTEVKDPKDDNVLEEVVKFPITKEEFKKLQKYDEETYETIKKMANDILWRTYLEV